MYNDKKILRASLLVTLSGILYGFLGYLGTELIRADISITSMLFWRFLVAACWMLPFVIKKHIKTNLLANANIRVLIFMFFLGAFGYAGSSGFYFMAAASTGTGLAMVIFFSYPIAVVLFSWLVYRQKISYITWFTLIAMIIGLSLLRDSTSDPVSIFGVFFAVLSAVCYASYVIGSKKFSSAKINSALLTVIVCFGCAFIFLLLALATHSFSMPHTIKSWCDLLALGILVTAVPIQLMLEGLKHISSMRASIISVLEPLVTVFVGILLLHESISNIQILGVIVLLFSTLLVQFQKIL